MSVMVEVASVEVHALFFDFGCVKHLTQSLL
jgi:hypothetical protein